MHKTQTSNSEIDKITYVSYGKKKDRKKIGLPQKSPQM